METAPSLDDFMATTAAGLDLRRTISGLAWAAAKISLLVAHGRLVPGMSSVIGTNTDGDKQTSLDLRCHDLVCQALSSLPVAALASEESDDVTTLNPGAPLAVAIDPLDGSSNIDTNLPMGTIFSIVTTAGADDPFMGQGNRQLAAGFFEYGAYTTLVLTFDDDVNIFTLDPSTRTFRLSHAKVRVPNDTAEYAINASNYRHWDPVVRGYIDECLLGSAGARGRDFNMRWAGSLVAEAYRLILRGGIFLYPGDKRPGYGHGRLRLLYEARPIALLVERAGGGASTGHQRILDVPLMDLHQRVPLIFGSRDKVDRIERLYAGPSSGQDRPPLFSSRGLFRNES